MIILTLRTDKPEAELALFDDQTELASVKWQAHRELAEKLLTKTNELITSQQKSWPDLQGLVVYKGPGSFTGLRIGLTVANTLAYSLSIPILASAGEGWQGSGIEKLCAGENETTALPEYGAEAFVTLPRK